MNSKTILDILGNRYAPETLLVLGMPDYGGVVGTSALAEQVGCNHNRLSLLLTRMQLAGLVEREQISGRGNRCRWHLTGLGGHALDFLRHLEANLPPQASRRNYPRPDPAAFGLPPHPG